MPGSKPGHNAGTFHDQSYPSQIAAERPSLVTRIYCEYDYEYADPVNTVRGGTQPIHNTERVDEFNRELRGGQRAERLRRG